MRAIGLGSCSGMARVGAIITPFVAQVSKVTWEQKYFLLLRHMQRESNNIYSF